MKLIRFLALVKRNWWLTSSDTCLGAW